MNGAVILWAVGAVAALAIVRSVFRARNVLRALTPPATGRTAADVLMGAVVAARSAEEGPELAEAVANALTYSAGWTPGSHVRLVPPIHDQDR